MNSVIVTTVALAIVCSAFYIVGTVTGIGAILDAARAMVAYYPIFIAFDLVLTWFKKKTRRPNKDDGQ